MSWLGALLVTAAGFCMGLSGSRELGNTVRRREQLCWLLERLAGELESFNSPLPELFGALEHSFDGELRLLCRHVAEGITGAVEPFGLIWAGALAYLPRLERQMLLPLGSVLGRYGTAEQLPAIFRCRREMERALQEARDRRRELGRVYIGLGTAGGLMLAVLLI